MFSTAMSKTALALLAVIGLYREIVQAHTDYDERAWNGAGEYLAQYIDPTKRPCHEFFEHSCGNYPKESENSLVEHTATLKKSLLEMITKIDIKSKKTSLVGKTVRQFYDNCMTNRENVDYDEDLDKAISAILRKIFQFDNTSVEERGNSTELPFTVSNIWQVVGRLKREIGLDIPILIAFSADWSEVRKGSRFLLKPALSGIKPTDEYKRVAISELDSLIPSIDWKSYFDELLPHDFRENVSDVKNTEVVGVYLPEQLEEIGQTVQTNSSLRQALTVWLWFLASEHLRSHMEMHVQYNDTSELLCIDTTIRHLPAAVSRIYFKDVGQDILALRQDILVLARNIFSAFRFLLNNVEWLDAHSIEKIQKKVDDISFYPGIPDCINNDTMVMADTIDYLYLPELTIFENELRFLKLRTEQKLWKAFLQLEDRPDFEVNAFYQPMGNKIVAQLGLFTPPVYRVQYPLAVKYGGYGYVLGHEMMHAFDSEGVLTPGPHLDGEWLEKEVLDEFEKRKSCLVKQYSTYCFADEKACVRGNLTISENIADIDGLKVAYTAFKFANQVFGDDPPIPNLLQYTQDQLFFLATSRLWCSKGFRAGSLDDPRTPRKPRVDVMMRNIPLFARAFGCPVGSAYAPLKICSVWGDLDNPARKH